MEYKLNQVQKEYSQKISEAKTLKELDEIYLKLFGKSGEITLIPSHFGSLSAEDKQIVGPLFNKVKQELEKVISEKRGVIREEGYKKLSQENFDLGSKVEIKKRQGYLHPLDKFEREIVELFTKLGFQQYESPEIDTDKYNFELVNMPADHPARDLQDTLYLDLPAKSESEKLLLRTQTSNSQVRIMKTYPLPIRMMVLGRCFRYENLDSKHEHTFDQFELVYIDKNLSMANLQYLSEYFLREFLDKDIKVRLRPKYYPFVEPGVGIDCECIFCQGKGCRVCSGVGWLEVGGAGMIHPTVLENGGIDPTIYSGIAWGPGLERILMLKYGVNDLRLFRNGDLSFLQKVGEQYESK